MHNYNKLIVCLQKSPTICSDNRCRASAINELSNERQRSRSTIDGVEEQYRNSEQIPEKAQYEMAY